MSNYLKTFIASSKENIELAEAIQSNLSQSGIHTKIWNQGTFDLGENFLNSIINDINECDFAIIVLSADDKLIVEQNFLQSNKKKQMAFKSCPRDNVVFEMGICVGILGYERTFYIFDKTVKKPTDIDGITGAAYSLPDIEEKLSNKDLRSILGPASTSIGNKIKQLGYRFKYKDRLDNYKTSVDMYYYKKNFTKTEVDKIAHKLTIHKIDFNIFSHDDTLIPDSIFIGSCVNSDCARKILSLVPYPIKYIFRPDYPDVDGGDMNGHKIGIGYASKYNSQSLNVKSKPIKITTTQLNKLLDPKLSNTEFQSYLFHLTILKED